MHTIMVTESCGYVLSVEDHATEEDMANAFFTVTSVLSSPFTVAKDEDGDIEVVVQQHRVCDIHN